MYWVKPVAVTEKFDFSFKLIYFIYLCSNFDEQNMCFKEAETLSVNENRPVFSRMVLVFNVSDPVGITLCHFVIFKESWLAKINSIVVAFSLIWKFVN